MKLAELIREARVVDLGPLPAPRLGLNATAYQALQMLIRGRRGAVVVLDGTRPVGMFTQRQVLQHISDGLFTSRELRRHAPLRDVMSSPAPTIERHASVAEAARILIGLPDRHLVVVDRDGALSGLLTMPDIVQFIVDQFPQETMHLPPGLAHEFDKQEGA